MPKRTEDLFYAAQYGEASKLTSLLKAGANPNSRDKYRRTPLHWACQEGHLAVVKRLTKLGANLDSVDNCHASPLRQAVGEGHLRIVNHLLRAGANVNQKCKADDNGSILQTASAWNRLEIAKRLVSFGANINAKDSSGRTALYFAVMYGHLAVARFLIKQGAVVDLNFRDKEERKTLLELAAAGRNSKMTSLLKTCEKIDRRE
jgi:ankyrin repeat protein